MKNKNQGMVKPVNSGASLASGLQQQSNYQFAAKKKSGKMTKGGKY